MNSLLTQATLQSHALDATPVVRHFLQRLQLPQLLQQHLPPGGRRPDALHPATTLCALVTNLLLARRPLYAIPDWLAQHVPEHLGLQPEQLSLIQDDRLGRALDRLWRADRASLLTALVQRAVREFAIDLQQFHNDTTTITFSGDYAHQPDAAATDRPPRITFGFNKDHRPDLKQLLYSVTISNDGAVPVHCKIYDGNTTDDNIHVETWSFLRQLVGHVHFLYVADSKLCTRDNMGFIADKHGQFLTVLPGSRAEDGWFRTHLQQQPVAWQEVRRETNPRHRAGPASVYHGVESPQGSSEGYRVLWYRSSLKQHNDQQQRQQRLRRAWDWLGEHQAQGRPWLTAAKAQAAGAKVLAEYQVERWLRVQVVPVERVRHRQSGPGRPSAATTYRRVVQTRYEVVFVEDSAAVAAEAKCDGLFALVTNVAERELSLAQALAQYKYQPFVEKRHEQLKSVYEVRPVWLKNSERIASFLWLYFVVELVGALVEREVRRGMKLRQWKSLAVYAEGRQSEAPTAGSVWGLLEGLRRHQLYDGEGRRLRTFYDPLPEVAEQLLDLLGIDKSAYGVV